MKEFTILVDVDDVLLDTLYWWVDALNIKYGTSVNPLTITDWEISTAFPTLSRDEIYSPLFDCDFWKYVKPKPDAPYYLKRLIDDGYKIIIVTNTYKETAEFKFNNALFPNFPYLRNADIVLTDKKYLVKGDILIDDYLKNLVSSNWHPIMFDAPHNRKYNCDMFGIYRAKSWEDIYNYVKCKFDIGV